MHLFFYTIFCWLYQLAVRIAALWNPKARRWVRGRKGIFPQLRTQLEALRAPLPQPSGQEGIPFAMASASPAQPPLIWMHCASLGEFEQGRPVLESLRARHPHARILLSFFSPSGYEVRKEYPGADLITYLPMDSKANARQFLDIVNPSLVIWVKYEYWYYYLTALKKRQIPTLLISGIFRPGQPFFKWYGRLHRYILDSFTHLFVQNQASADLLQKIGFSRQVTVNGDTRFDRVATIAAAFSPLPNIEAFCGHHPVVVAGSTWDADEEELDHYANTHPELRFIIAPHEIGEDHLKDIGKLFKYSVRYSRWTPGDANGHPNGGTPNTLIIDNIGMLSRLYRYAHITYVGGGFGSDGIHNVLEAAVYSKPVVFGPVYDKFQEATELLETGGAFSVDNALELEKTFNDLLKDPGLYGQSAAAAGRYVQEKTGATQAILQFIAASKWV
ncbi:MAG: glycosyltransferase N-terminal domain-containing protein [Candidatus Pseudobacter hemicellulosilyticus]|uniref:3-deoxy-D-manno-octulosonic acid transferase n=1 Tax=Candidatus Pseudobacter hemicellulosilyticus TaxID=3121375 RepID=A0AAJ5WPD6_9BACT|nr:MAG: glycosyltransferase N-terminal domain-containing protein [Pseudobacter sp.]